MANIHGLKVGQKVWFVPGDLGEKEVQVQTDRPYEKSSEAENSKSGDGGQIDAFIQLLESKKSMTRYDNQITQLATEIVEHLQGSGEDDIEFVCKWLIHGGDDGSEATDLVMKFSEQNVLPSQSE